MTIVSLSSIPPRFQHLDEVLYSLEQQDADIEEIRLYIPKSYRRFPNWDGTLPQVSRRVRLVQVEDDLGPASKVLHAAQELKGTKTPILFCDDDRIYHPKWASGLLCAHNEKRQCCIAVSGWHLHNIVAIEPLPTPGKRADYKKRYSDRIHQIKHWMWRLHRSVVNSPFKEPLQTNVGRAGYTEILRGFAGALVMPDFFDELVYDIPDEVWMVDDIWLSGHLARLGIAIWVPKKQAICSLASSEEIAALRSSVFGGANRRSSNKQAVQYFQDRYGVWKYENRGGSCI